MKHGKTISSSRKQLSRWLSDTANGIKTTKHLLSIQRNGSKKLGGRSRRENFVIVPSSRICLRKRRAMCGRLRTRMRLEEIRSRWQRNGCTNRGKPRGPIRRGRIMSLSDWGKSALSSRRYLAKRGRRIKLMRVSRLP